MSAYAALMARRFTSVAMAFSGLVALLHRPKASPGDHTIPSTPDAPHSTTLKVSESEWERFVRSTVSMAMRDVAEILPGWSIDIHAFESHAGQCYEFVLRAETPPEWSSFRDAGGGRIVPGPPQQEWYARVYVPFMEIHRARSKMAFSVAVLRRLSEFARDIRREAPAPEPIRLPNPCCRVPKSPGGGEFGFDLLATP